MVFADFTNHTVVIVNNKDTDETFILNSNNGDSVVSFEKMLSLVTGSFIVADFEHVFPYLIAQKHLFLLLLQMNLVTAAIGSGCLSEFLENISHNMILLTDFFLRQILCELLNCNTASDRSSPPKFFLEKGILKICRTFTGELHYRRISTSFNVSIQLLLMQISQHIYILSLKVTYIIVFAKSVLSNWYCLYQLKRYETGCYRFSLLQSQNKCG